MSSSTSSEPQLCATGPWDHVLVLHPQSLTKYDPACNIPTNPGGSGTRMNFCICKLDDDLLAVGPSSADRDVASIRIVSLSSRKQVRRINVTSSGGMHDIVWIPEWCSFGSGGSDGSGGPLFVGGTSDAVVKLWRARSGEELQQFASTPKTYALLFIASWGDRLVVAGAGHYTSSSRHVVKSPICMYDVHRSVLVGQVREGRDASMQTFGLAAGLSSDLLISAAYSPKRLFVWDPKDDLRPVTTSPLQLKEGATALHFAEDQHALIVGGNDSGNVEIWDIRQYSRIVSFNPTNRCNIRKIVRVGQTEFVSIGSGKLSRFDLSGKVLRNVDLPQAGDPTGLCTVGMPWDNSDSPGATGEYDSRFGARDEEERVGFVLRVSEEVGWVSCRCRVVMTNQEVGLWRFWLF